MQFMLLSCFFKKMHVINFTYFSQAGMLAVRENRYIVLAKDFEKAYKTVIKKDEQEHEFYKQRRKLQPPKGVEMHTFVTDLCVPIKIVAQRCSDCDLHKLLENFGKVVLHFHTAAQDPMWLRPVYP